VEKLRVCVSNRLHGDEQNATFLFSSVWQNVSHKDVNN